MEEKFIKNWESRLRAQKKYTRTVDPRKHLWNSAKARAKVQDVPFSISVDDIMIPTHCPYLGVEIGRSKGSVSAYSPSLDKIIPSLGYVKGNIQVISHKANVMKNNASIDELLAFARNVQRLHGGN